MQSLFSVPTLETRFGLRVGVGASRFQAKFQSIRTGPFDEKLSTEYKLDIPIQGDDLKSCIGRFPTGSARWPEVLSTETKRGPYERKEPDFLDFSLRNRPARRAGCDPSADPGRR